jgi:SAM-dependent methyltransferase
VRVSGLPEDPSERLAWLEQWAAEQRDRVGDHDSMRARLRQSFEATLERHTERLDRILDRGLGTAHDAFFPNAPDWGGAASYVAGPTPWHVLPRALHRIGASDHDVFVEFGCGKGRVVHQAAKRPLKRVIGVEIVPEVAGFAQSLVAAHQDKYRCRNVEIVACDAAQFRVPDDLTIAYHAYGFPEKTLDVVLQNLIESIERSPRLVRFIYHWPIRGVGEVLATARLRPSPGVSFGRTAIFESYL